jgi:hypothetical protein
MSLQSLSHLSSYASDEPTPSTYADSSRDGSELAYSLSRDSSAVDPTELEAAQAADRQAARASKQLCTSSSTEGVQWSRVVDRSELRAHRPKHLPGLAFTAEEFWQLRKVFDIFAAKYRRHASCSASGARTAEEEACGQTCPNAPTPQNFTVQSFELAVAQQKSVPLLGQRTDERATLYRSSDAEEVVPITDADDAHQDLIRMADYSYCFASWTGLTCCEASLNVHLYWSCAQVQHDSHTPCVTFAQFVQGFGDYCFADTVSGAMCADPSVRRKRLFRSLAAEVFESLKLNARMEFNHVLALQEFACVMCPPLYALRPMWTATPITPMPPFSTHRGYFLFLAIAWITSILFPLILPHLDPQYEEYTQSSRLCEVETYGLVSLYIFLGVYWSVMLGSNYNENDWEIALKRDLDWLSLCRVRSPLGCVSRIRNAKDIFEQIFSQVYMSSADRNAPNSTDRQTRGSFRFLELSKVSWGRCLFWLLMSFLLSFPIAFLPTLYRSTIAHVDLIPTGERIPEIIVFNFMFSSISLTMVLVNLNFITYQSYRDFASTLQHFNDLFLLSRAQRDDTPYLPLHNPLNVRSWSMMRRYLLEIHMLQKITFLENIYGILFLTVIGGVVFVVAREVMSNTTYASSFLVLYVAVLFAIQLLCMIFKGECDGRRRGSHMAHPSDAVCSTGVCSCC